MKKKFIIAAFILSALLGCSKSGFLDQVKTTDLNEATTFADSARTMQFLTRIYTDIGFSADPKRFGGSVGIYSIGDEVEGSSVGASAYNIIFQTGSVSSLNIPSDSWEIPYANIRRVNILLHHLPTVPLSENLKNRIRGEARFLRAWYYFILMKHYGGIPLIGDVVYAAGDEITGERATFENCVAYVLQESEAAAALLPLVHQGLDYGRITRGACLGLKARMLLYAASPLFNGRSEMDGILGYSQFDANRWNRAADAARDLIQLNQYALYELPDGLGFQKLFTLRKNSEYILATMAGNNRTLEAMWDPPSRGGNGSMMPYQELVDAFGMRNGKPITDPTSGYNPDKPYENRDPRFGWTILHNEGKRLNVSKTITDVFTYVSAPQDGFPIAKTGYFLRKLLDDNTISSTTSSTTERCFPLMRYAEVLLNYAEAINETGNTEAAYEPLQMIRSRAGIVAGADGLYGLDAQMSQEQMRKTIQNERRVELAIEEHRYWDVRRWKIAEQVSNKPLHGMRITRVGTTSPAVYQYEKVVIRTPVFIGPKWYLWPIPQSEVNKSIGLKQNPGW